MTFNEKLDYAFNLIIGYRYEKFSRIYPFTTENINGYLSNYDLEGKSVLTVGSSGDQILNSYFMGAKEVTLFDSNPLSKYYYDLKVAALKTLSREEFFEFFCYLNYPKAFSKNNCSLNYDLYSKVSLFLSGESKLFWDSLYSNFSPLRIRKKLFSDDEYNYNVVLACNSYLKDIKSYNLLKDRISDCSPLFINIDIRDITKLLNSTYDFILLSNIGSYLELIYENGYEDFYNNMIDLMKFLNKDGIMFMSYLYDMVKETKICRRWSAIYHLDRVFEIFKNENISIESFNGVANFIYNDPNCPKDSVLILKK